MPQPLAGQDYFSVFGLPRTFKIDRNDLQTRFYKISRALHPDRFSTANADAKKLSLERMSFVNEAYGTLKNPESLREYVLETEGLKAEAAKKAQIPMELAESWFDLQEALVEDPSSAAEKLSTFQGELNALFEAQDRELEEIEGEIESAWSTGGNARASLEKLYERVQNANYMRSMARDVANKISGGHL